MNPETTAERLRELADELTETEDEPEHPLASVFTHTQDKLVWRYERPAVVLGYIHLTDFEIRHAREEGYRIAQVCRSDSHEQGDGPMVVFEGTGDE